MSHYVKLRYVLKAGAAAGWVIVMPVAYAYSWKNASGFALTIKNWFGGHSHNSPSLFIVAILIYLSPNMLSALLFLFPFIRRYLERSDFKIMMLMMWWSQVRPYPCAFYLWLNVCIEPKISDLSWLLCGTASAVHRKGYAWECVVTFQVRSLKSLHPQAEIVKCWLVC